MATDQVVVPSPTCRQHACADFYDQEVKKITADFAARWLVAETPREREGVLLEVASSDLSVIEELVRGYISHIARS